MSIEFVRKNNARKVNCSTINFMAAIHISYVHMRVLHVLYKHGYAFIYLNTIHLLQFISILLID